MILVRRESRGAPKADLPADAEGCRGPGDTARKAEGRGDRPAPGRAQGEARGGGSPARSAPRRGLRGPAAIKGPGRRGLGRPGSCARAGAMREGLGAACEAARPRLCRLLRRILRPQPACGPRRARYSRRAGSALGGRRAAPRRHRARTRARGSDPLRSSVFRQTVRVGTFSP